MSYYGHSLYVGDLCPEVNEQILMEKFSKVGDLLSLRLCRSQTTQRSLGYAYINYRFIQDAEKALDTINFDPILGRPIRLMWSQRDPALRKSGKGNIFIKNIHPSIDNKCLLDIFSQFGFILSGKIVSDENGSKGYGFVHFDSETAAEKAIENANGMMVKDKKMYVAKFIHKKDRLKEKYKFSNVYINNFGSDLNDESLKTLFLKFGEIVSVKVMVDERGEPRGFGFVSYEIPEDAEKAVKEMNGFKLNGRKLFAGRAQKKEERMKILRERFEQGRKVISSRSNLYIKNLDDEFDDERLRKEFMKFGEISSSRIMTENGRSRGFGFVCFTKQEAAERAMREMSGAILIRKPLFVSFALNKEERWKKVCDVKLSYMSEQKNTVALNGATSYPQQMHMNNVTGLQSPLIAPMTNPLNFVRGPINPPGFANRQISRHTAGQPTGYGQNIPTLINTHQLYSAHSHLMGGVPLQHQLPNASLMTRTANAVPQYKTPHTQFNHLTQTSCVTQTKTDNLSTVSPRYVNHFPRDRLFTEVKKINHTSTHKI